MNGYAEYVSAMVCQLVYELAGESDSSTNTINTLRGSLCGFVGSELGDTRDRQETEKWIRLAVKVAKCAEIAIERKAKEQNTK
jgi:hypothetical protein